MFATCEMFRQLCFSQFETSFLGRKRISVNSHMNIHTTELRELNKYKTTQ